MHVITVEPCYLELR